jgi:hypothetical protein
MPGYAAQIPVEDRWAIVLYVRALQRSRNAGPDDVPADIRARLRPAEGATEEENSQDANNTGNGDPAVEQPSAELEEQ